MFNPEQPKIENAQICLFYSRSMMESSEVVQRPETSKADIKIFTPAERIHQLNEIDKDVASLLRAAGQAVNSLTNPPSGNLEEPVTIEAHKESFSKATATYFSLLSSINVRLRRQIYALEEADIIASDSASKDSQTAGNAPTFGAAGGGGVGGAAIQADKGEISRAGLGNLDVGWLNSRSDIVGREMEGEIWAKAREFLERLEQKNSRGSENGEMEIMEQDNLEV
ncbi:MAG: hypothetical protein M1813_001499 [Trichoglossum hirsutum]|nr:MAG: hypothetical protein M1813_001499 [Trichoglossum hirsutum]